MNDREKQSLALVAILAYIVFKGSLVKKTKKGEVFNDSLVKKTNEGVDQRKRNLSSAPVGVLHQWDIKHEGESS